MIPALMSLAWPVAAHGQETGANALLQRRPFLQIPGPNPILMCGAKGAWDESVIEACDAVEDFGSYYFFYHGVAKDKQRWPGGYRIGLAKAPHPLGPWTKHGDKPVLDLGPKGAWDDECVACAAILREAPGKYLMWYSARSSAESGKKRPPGHTPRWDIGLAIAPKLEGPWTKHEKNPVLPNFGYVGGIVKRAGKYLLYTAHPLNSTAPDYGPIALATAERPEGPWTPWERNPVLPPSDKGAWDDGGCSEAKVTFWDGAFHLFYGGAKEYLPRIQTRESIGYAWSLDGLRFVRYGGNPVAAREAQPNAAAFAEVHTLFEPPFVYAYHTLRYVDPKQVPLAGKRTSALEDLGVQVLVMQRPFRLAMPVLTRETLAAGAATELPDCPTVCLSGATAISLTVECAYASTALKGLRVHVRSSADGMHYDTADVLTFDNDFQAGGVGRKTVGLDITARFIKLWVENLDQSAPCRNLKLTATLGG